MFLSYTVVLMLMQLVLYPLLVNKLMNATYGFYAEGKIEAPPNH